MEEDSEWDASGEVETCCDGVADEARRAMLNDGARAAGKLVVSTELMGSWNVNGVVETESVETGGMENTGPGQLKAEAAVDIDAVELTGGTITERASGNNEGDENAGSEDEVVSKRSKS